MEAATRLVEETTLQISPTFDNLEDAELESDAVGQNSISNIEFEQSPEDGGTITSDQETSESAVTSNVEEAIDTSITNGHMDSVMI